MRCFIFSQSNSKAHVSNKKIKLFHPGFYCYLGRAFVHPPEKMHFLSCWNKWTACVQRNPHGLKLHFYSERNVYWRPQLWNIKRCWVCLNIQETPQTLAFFPRWSAGFWKRRKVVEASMRAYDWRLATPAMPFKPPHVPSLVWSDPNSNNVPTVLHFAALYGDDFQRSAHPQSVAHTSTPHKNIPASLLFLC